MSKQTPEATRRYRETHREQIASYKISDDQRLAYQEARKLKHYLNPVDLLFYAAKHRAKRDGLEFNLDKSDILIPPFCPILDLPLFVCKDKAGNCSPTLDRVDNTQGYVKGNVQVISYRANTLKNELTEEVLERILQYVKGTKKHVDQR